MGREKLVALVSMTVFMRLVVIVVLLLLALPWVCLQFVIVVFPDHTQLLY